MPGDGEYIYFNDRLACPKGSTLKGSSRRPRCSANFCCSKTQVEALQWNYEVRSRERFRRLPPTPFKSSTSVLSGPGQVLGPPSLLAGRFPGQLLSRGSHGTPFRDPRNLDEDQGVRLRRLRHHWHDHALRCHVQNCHQETGRVEEDGQAVLDQQQKLSSRCKRTCLMQ